MNILFWVGAVFGMLLCLAIVLMAPALMVLALMDLIRRERK
jgi:uncharacterized membrane protein YoaK (UPF0700 family)